MTLVYVTHPDCLGHDMGAGHPECPARLHAIEDQLLASGLSGTLHRVDAPLATPAQLGRVHAAAYLSALAEASPRRGVVHLDPDTAMSPRTLTAARRAAGAVVMATDLVMSAPRMLRSARCAPPGITPSARAQWASAFSTTSPLARRMR